MSVFWVSPRQRGDTLFFWLLSTRKTNKVSPTDLNAPNAMRNASAFAELTIKEDSSKPLSFLNFKENTVLFDYSDYIYLKISASPIAACSQSKYHQRSLKCFPV